MGEDNLSAARWTHDYKIWVDEYGAEIKEPSYGELRDSIEYLRQMLRPMQQQMEYERLLDQFVDAL